MVEIRAATPEDIKAIPGIIQTPFELFLVYPRGRFPFTLEQVQQLFQERFEFTVVYDGDQLIGFANLYDRHQDQYAFIGNVFIDTTYRGRGLGKLVLQYMIKAVFEKYQLSEARLSVFADNEPAIGMYRQFGFFDYASEMRVDPNNEEKRLLHMKLLKPRD